MASRLDQLCFDRTALCKPNDRNTQNRKNSRRQTRHPICHYGKDHAPGNDGNFSLCSTGLDCRNIRRVFVPGFCVYGVCQVDRKFLAAERRCGHSFVSVVFVGASVSREARNYNYVCSRYDLCSDSNVDREFDSRDYGTYWYRSSRRNLRSEDSPEVLIQCQPPYLSTLAIGRFAKPSPHFPFLRVRIRSLKFANTRDCCSNGIARSG